MILQFYKPIAFEIKGDQIELIPENCSMNPMIYTADRINIQGVVVGQARMY